MENLRHLEQFGNFKSIGIVSFGVGEEIIQEVLNMEYADLQEVSRFLEVITSGSVKAKTHICNFISNPPQGALKRDYIKILNESEKIMEVCRD